MHLLEVRKGVYNGETWAPDFLDGDRVASILSSSCKGGSNVALQTSAGLHADRIACCDRDHCRAGRPAPARGAKSPRGGQPYVLLEQPAPDFGRCRQL